MFVPSEKEYFIAGISNKDLKSYWQGVGLGAARRPLTAAANVGISFTLARLIRPAAALYPKASKVAGYGLAGLYGADVYGRVQASNRPSFTLGEITSTEIVPFGVGGYLSTKRLFPYRQIKAKVTPGIKRFIKSESAEFTLSDWKKALTVKAERKAEGERLKKLTAQYGGGVSGYREKIMSGFLYGEIETYPKVRFTHKKI